jgi:hypothetical protein
MAIQHETTFLGLDAPVAYSRIQDVILESRKVTVQMRTWANAASAVRVLREDGSWDGFSTVQAPLGGLQVVLEGESFLALYSTMPDGSLPLGALIMTSLYRVLMQRPEFVNPVSV